ncbi:MAG TPA: pilus assembly protein N-terminal domain-containing protein [Vicinamibacterales bacterium]|nr:pilus assembly protein N-terminal domain-containing protein [Vicinamibacterales bacterium]
MGAARGPASKIAALVAFIIVILVATPQAQQSASFSGVPGAMTAGPAAVPPNATEIDLLVGRSTILNVGSAIARVSLTVPDIADAMVTAPQQLLIHGKTPGTISLFVWDRAGGIKTYEVSVRRDLSHLVEQMRNLFPGEQITVAGSGKDVVLSGTVSSKYVIDKAADVASGFVEKKENIVNLLKQQEGVASNQVLLRVRFAEVSRNAMQELGASMILDRFKSDAWDARTSTQQFAAPDFDSSKPGQLNFSDFLNLFVFNSKQGFGAVVKALQNKGLFQSLAEPNLIALNGKEASFLAGGEYPYPVAQGGSGNNAVTIMFKEFGVRLSFTPTVLGGDLINLKVKPEVSSLDFANGVSISGFRVPALSTRRTETEVELQDGQTFAIAGLMNNTVSSTMSKIPGIGDIPVLGFLFKSRAYQKAQTELVVMITPTIVRRGSTGASQGLPTAVEPYLGAPAKPMAQPAPYIGSPRYPAGPQSRTSGAAQQNDNTTVASPGTQTVPATVQSAAPVAPELWTPADKQPAAQKAPTVDAKGTRKAGEARAIADKKAVQDKAIADKKASEDAVRQQKADVEKAKRDAEVAKKNAEAERKRQEDLKKQEKTVAEAAARLKQAQAAYQAEMDKKKGLQ